jgi:hypothetical protein
VVPTTTKETAMNRTLGAAALALGLLCGGAVAQNKVYQLGNPFPFPVQLRILGDGPQFPSVVNMPVGPGVVPVPYPDINMRLQIKQPNGQWSPTLKLPWRSGTIMLPSP